MWPFGRSSGAEPKAEAAEPAGVLFPLTPGARHPLELSDFASPRAEPCISQFAYESKRSTDFTPAGAVAFGHGHGCSGPRWCLAWGGRGASRRSDRTIIAIAAGPQAAALCTQGQTSYPPLHERRSLTAR